MPQIMQQDMTNTVSIGIFRNMQRSKQCQGQLCCEVDIRVTFYDMLRRFQFRG